MLISPKYNKITVLTIVISVLFLTSIGINLYQHNKINEYNKNIEDLKMHYMSMHAVVFSNALSSIDTSDVQSVMDIKTLSQIIEEVQKAMVYYQDAKYTKNYWSEKQGADSGLQTEVLIDGYITELKSVRLKLLANDNLTNDDVSNVTGAINDLKVVAEWLEQKERNNELTLYGDRYFYDNVYGKLTSDIKEKYSSFRYN